MLYDVQSDKGYTSAKNSLPPAWVDQIEAAEEDVAKIQARSKFLSLDITYFSAHGYHFCLIYSPRIVGASHEASYG